MIVIVDVCPAGRQCGTGAAQHSLQRKSASRNLTVRVLTKLGVACQERLGVLKGYPIHIYIYIDSTVMGTRSTPYQERSKVPEE